MRKLSAYLLMSLDGVVEEPQNWTLDYDEEMQTHLLETINEQDAVLLGRVAYQEWARVWPNADFEPEFKQFINSTPKYVVSTTLSSVNDWQPTTLIKENVASTIAVLKQHPGKTIGVHSSLTLVRSLLDMGLLDELVLTVFPVLVGKGRHLLSPEDSFQRLKLVFSQSTRTGGLNLISGYESSPILRNPFALTDE